MTQSVSKVKDSLSQIIEEKRKEMLDTANIFGMSNARTLKHSQDLDELILEYQRLTSKD
ncbi:aspartyl-phosphate phosphatase Spo0E family protein [Lentibacillus sediminis]|uniref:aspartyl-phosphate phosphatase Spo0E family protein n=1 Tax=Lentibacillus sediminis TaxID=1940529 RepID=UPI000C1C51F9|nr:aspartyl-phosphate phosphatase Spo0E family protein [Lentibacillus sediminis]